MALFNRKKRSGGDGDNVHLGSADHSWWTGEGPPSPPRDDAAPGEGDDDVLGRAESWGNDDVAPLDHDVAPDDLANGIAQALSDYRFASGADQPESAQDVAGTDDHDDLAGVHFAAELQGDWQVAASEDELARELIGRALFVCDGLPAKDHLGDLLGALGLEGDADWIDIARAHRRLVTGSTSGRADWEQERQRRVANEAYACLRLFHH